MGKYIQGSEREQLVLFPTSLEDMVEADNPVRIIDAFVDSLDLVKLGIKRAIPKSKGTPSYNPADLLKLYLYGYENKVRSSRKLMRMTKINTEVMWLMKGLKPDFRTISDFRKDNVDKLKGVFRDFNLICKDLEILNFEQASQDGTKIRAVNAKDKNYTLNKLDDRISNLEEKIDGYMKEMEESDKKEKTPKMVENIETMKARKARYESYRDELQRTGQSQKSLTDPDSKLMKDKEGFNVCYNDQVLVDTDSHLIINYEVTTNPADFGSMESILDEAEEMYGVRVKENITDNGYSDRDDMLNCLLKGTFPQVTPKRGDNSFTLTMEYKESEISEEEINSSRAEDIEKCLKAGVIPKIYEGKIDKIEIVEVKEKRKKSTNNKIIDTSEYDDDELRDKAMHEGKFIRDIEKNLVWCPCGFILRQKSKKGEDGIKYCNKLACKNCKNPCTRAQFKEVVFKGKNNIIEPRERKNKDLKKEDETLKESTSDKNLEDVSNLEEKSTLKKEKFDEVKESDISINDALDLFEELLEEKNNGTEKEASNDASFSVPKNSDNSQKKHESIYNFLVCAYYKVFAFIQKVMNFFKMDKNSVVLEKDSTKRLTNENVNLKSEKILSTGSESVPSEIPSSSVTLEVEKILSTGSDSVPNEIPNSSATLEVEKTLSTGNDTGNKIPTTGNVKKKVNITLTCDRESLAKRMCTSEHPHGTMKRYDDASYLLLRGKEKVAGEMALYYCAYNIRRAINMIGVSELLRYFEAKKSLNSTGNIFCKKIDKIVCNLLSKIIKCVIMLLDNMIMRRCVI